MPNPVLKELKGKAVRHKMRLAEGDHPAFCGYH